MHHSVNVLFIQPFIIEHYSDQETLTQMLLVWPVYLENFLKSKFRDLNCSLLYLPDEQKLGNITIKSYKDSELFAKQMDKLLNTLDFEITQNTYICLSGTTSYYYLSVKMISEYFQKHHPEGVIIFGGAHATACPDDFIYAQSPIDYIIIGEGEQVLYEIIKKNYKKQSTPKFIIGKPISELDILPPLDLSILDRYISFYQSLSICLSRGCPFNCSFCMEKTMASHNKSIKRWRSYTPKRAIEESRIMIEYAQNYGIDRIGFVDPTFGSNRKWFEEYISLWNFEAQTSAVWIETRFDILNDKLIEQLQKKNFYLWYGLESCSKRMLKIMNKNVNPSSYLKKYDKIIEKHKDLEYLVMNNVIFGHPGESEKSCAESYKVLKRIKEQDT
ncbi:MAG: radical SAM protein, partial [Promethearchaeota archaeon]